MNILEGVSNDERFLLMLRLRFSLSSALFLATLLSGISVSAFAQSRLPATPDTAIRLAQPNRVLVRNFRGKRLARARAVLRGRGLKVNVLYQWTGSRHNANRVLRQDPLPDTRVNRGYTVTLTVWGYGGPRPVVEQVIVPDLHDRFLRHANYELRLRGLKIQRFRPNDFARTWDRDLALGGRVFWQSRAPGTLVRRGSTVRLQVYLLRTDRRTTVPDLRNVDIYSALIGYRQAGLNVRAITYLVDEDLRLEGTVFSTRPPAGRVVPARSSIRVRIRIRRVSPDRLGKYTVPNLLNQDLSRALRGLFIASFNIGSINVVNTRDSQRHALVSAQSIPPGSRTHNRNQIDLRVDFKTLR